MRAQSLILLWVTICLVACHNVPEEKVLVRLCPTPPEARACASSFAINDTIYIFGGRTTYKKATNTMMTFVPSKQEWTNDIATPLVSRVNGVACTHKGVAYLGLGHTGGSIYTETSYLRDWWQFNPSTYQWTRLADFPSNKTVAAIAFADDNNIWVGFGFNGFGDELWSYSITENKWESVPHQKVWPERLMSSVAASVGGRHFHGTGYRRKGHNDWWEFVAQDSHWERRASVPGEGRHNATCAATDHHCWMIGGWHYGDSLTTGYYFEDILRYSPTDDQWTICGTIPCGATENGVACAIGNTLYFGLGENNKSELHLKWYCIEE